MIPPHDLELGSITLDDVASLVALERRVWLAAPDYDEEPWSEENFLRQVPGKFELSLVARRDGEPVAFLIASFPRGSTTHIHRLAVAPEEQGRGVGSRMLQEFAMRNKAPVSVTVAQENGPAMRLYLREGFVHARLNQDNKFVMIRDLAEAEKSGS